MRSPGFRLKDDARKLLEEFTVLLATRESRSLSDAESSRLELLRDLVIEAGILSDAETTGGPRRSARLKCAFEVSFSTAKEAAEAVTRDVGTHGLSILVQRPLPQGTVLSIELKVPGWAQPFVSDGEVVWTSREAMGVRFEGLTAEKEAQLRRLVSESTTFIDSIRRLLRAPKPVKATVSSVGVVLVRLNGSSLSEVVANLLTLNGLLVTERISAHTRPDLIVSDIGLVSRALELHRDVPVVLVNVTSPKG